MATVVYDGASGGGTLFKGMKFFLMQRLPTRDRWKELVKSNGGEVVQIEKQADMIIADHVRKDIPPGSISWKFIEQSVAKGALEDLDDYRAGRVVGTIREVGSAQPARKGKIAFTAEDDRILMEWCIKAERKGLSVKGNEIYKQLEEKNNRHTFQSWRDRWVKYLSNRPRPTLPEDGEDEDDAEAEDDERLSHNSPKFRPPENRRNVSRSIIAPRNAPASSSTARPQQSRNANERKTVRKSSPAPSPAVKPSAGKHFTEDDTDLLLDAYDDILNLSDDQVIDAWLAWAESGCHPGRSLNYQTNVSQYPNHTAQEWRNYFKEYVVPKKRAENESREISPPALKRPKATPVASSSKNESAKTREVQDSQDSSCQITQSPKMQRKNADPATIDEKLFKGYLVDLADSLEMEVDFTPEICGRKIPLFRLWQVIQSDEFGGFDRVNGKNLWPNVARKLNFNDFRQTTAAQELRGCYSEILADFEDARQEYDEEPGLTDSQERAMLDAQLLETAARQTQNLDEEDMEEDEELVEEDEEDDDLDRPQVSPHPPVPTSSSKRSFGADRTNVDTSFNKRQRIDKGKGKELEIPSTPEDIINSNQMPRPALKPSPLKFSSAAHQQQEEEDSSELEDLFVKPLKPRYNQEPKPQNLEPETQDFHYPQTQAEPDEEEHDSFVDISSSPPQQKLPDRSSGSNIANGGSDPSSNPTGSSTQSQTESEHAAELQKYIDHCVSLGYTQEAVVFALGITTMEMGAHCMQVMESLEDEQGIPDDIPGVWTEEDDMKVEEEVQSEGFKEMVRKHGIKRCEVRKSYLRDQREVRMERDAEGGG